VVGEVLTEDDLHQRLLKAHLAQPSQVALRPCLAGPVEDPPAAQQQLADPVARAHQIAAQILTRPDQVAQRLKLQGRHDDRSQRVTRVGL
jgi:hypothetical protein